MAIKLPKGGYACSYCEKVHPNPIAADACRDSHDLVYVQLSREDVVRLLQFIYTGEQELLNPRIIRDLRKYIKVKIDAKEDSYLSNL